MPAIIWCMKLAITLLLVILTVLACGCTATTSTAPTPSTATPSFLGTWSGTMFGYDEGTGYSDYGNSTMQMVVTEQQGRIFSGNFLFNFNGTAYTVPMAGVVNIDGKTFSIVEDANGYTTGEFIGKDEIQLIHLDNEKPISAAIDTLKRV